MIVLETVRAECGSGMSQRYAGWRIAFQKAISAAYKKRQAIRRVPRMSGEPPPQRIFAHTWLSGAVHGSHNAVSPTYATSAYDREPTMALTQEAHGIA
jgi:hypothetical protein